MCIVTNIRNTAQLSDTGGAREEGGREAEIAKWFRQAVAPVSLVLASSSKYFSAWQPGSDLDFGKMNSIWLWT